MSDASIGTITIFRGDGASPEVFTLVGEAKSLSGLGKTNELVEVTHFGSGGNREFISGLADGQEITVEVNYIQTDAPQQALINDVDTKTNRNIRVTIFDGTNTDTFDFSVTPISWVINPGLDDATTATFTLKISGDIVIS